MIFTLQLPSADTTPFDVVSPGDSFISMYYWGLLFDGVYVYLLSEEVGRD
jgi:hypothetical protein